MAEVDITIIAQRLVSLRKNLGEREGKKLSIQDLSDRLGIPDHKMIRLEHGKGSLEPLATLLVYYRSQNYNLDWILIPDNTNIPMIQSSGDELLVISELINKLSNRLKQDYSEITDHLTKLGYSPLEDKQFAGSEAVTPEVFDFSK